MAYVVKVLGIQSGDYFSDYMLDANCVAGAVALRSAAVASAGEVVDATPGAAANAIGLYADSVTYSATTSLSSSLGSPFGLLGGNELFGMQCRIVNHPLQICRFKVAGGATAGTGLALTVPANVLTNTLADATSLIVTAAEVGTVSMAGGLLKGKTGANGGQTRRIVTHTASADTRAEVAFTSPIAATDTFIRVPYSKAGIAMQFTTDLTEANGIIATGTGADMRVFNVIIDEVNNLAWVDAIFGTHWFAGA
jgi:hypothetical protein